MTDDERIPLGVPDLDFRLGGGVLPGYAVLSMGAVGTGYRELLYTAATVHGNRQLDNAVPVASDVYRRRPDGHRWPDAVHYVSLTRTEAQFERELQHVIDREWATAALDGITFESFADEFASLSTVGRLLTAQSDRDGRLDVPVNPDVTDADYRQFLRTLGDYLLEHASGNVVVIDGMTQLIPVMTKAFDWQEVYMVLTAIRQLFARLDAVVLTAVDEGLLSERERGLLVSAFDGVLQFDWEVGDTTRRRVMGLLKFRELLATMSESELAEFELDLEWGGIGIKNIRKISV